MSHTGRCYSACLLYHAQLAISKTNTGLYQSKNSLKCQVHQSATLYRTENWSANQIAATCQAALHVSGHGYTQNVNPQELFL